MKETITGYACILIIFICGILVGMAIGKKEISDLLAKKLSKVCIEQLK
jgi:hypothetical protein